MPHMNTFAMRDPSGDRIGIPMSEGSVNRFVKLAYIELEARLKIRLVGTCASSNSSSRRSQVDRRKTLG